MCSSGLALRSAASTFGFQPQQPVSILADSANHHCGVPPPVVCEFNATNVDTCHTEIEKAAEANTAAYAAASAPQKPEPVTAPVAEATKPQQPQQQKQAPTLSNGRAPEAEPVTAFHSKQVPPLSVLQLARVMQQSTRCDDEFLMMAAVLLVRYCSTSATPPTLHMVHRLYVTCLHVAIKTHSDGYFRNDTFAMLAGVAPAEMNALEAELMRGLQWRCLVTSMDVLPLAAEPVPFLARSCPRVPPAAPPAADCHLGVTSGEVSPRSHSRRSQRGPFRRLGSRLDASCDMSCASSESMGIATPASVGASLQSEYTPRFAL